MAKRTRPKTAKKGHRRTPAHKTGRYLMMYFISLFVGVVLFVAASLTFQAQQPLCANSATCKSDLSEKIENGASGMFEGHRVAVPNIDLATDNTHPSVLGTSTPNAPKHIYVDLAKQILYAYEGTTKVFQTYTATGRWNKTPVGNFHIWEKLRSTRMAGGEGADAYNLPNVPFVMYFYQDFGLHGAYWHDNFGHTMSHGCVNLRQIDAEKLYNWADGPSGSTPGTAVSICDSFTEPNMCAQTNPINPTL